MHTMRVFARMMLGLILAVPLAGRVDASDAPAVIHLGSDAAVHGKAYVGPGGNPSTDIVLDDGASITGGTGALTQSEPLTVQSYPDTTGTGPLTDSTALSEGTYQYTSVNLLANNTVTFTGNVVLYVDEGLTLNSQSAITAASDCSSCTLTIYVNGPVTLADGSTLAAGGQKPTNLALHVTAAQPVTLDANTTFYGQLDAAMSAVTLGSHAQLFGKMVADSVHLDSQAAVHYDAALAAGQSSTMNIVSWREL